MSSINVQVNRNDNIINVGINSTGPQGQSAYETWLALGNVGTKQDFIDSQFDEPIRVENENTRKNAETIRVQNENTRIENENDREDNEDIRNTAENIRVSNEDTRIAKENARNVYENYDNTHDYVIGNKVYYNGSSYLCIAPCKDVLPTVLDNWLLISAGGNTPAASAVPIQDAAGHFTATNVEQALKETAEQIKNILNGTETVGNATNANNANVVGGHHESHFVRSFYYGDIDVTNPAYPVPYIVDIPNGTEIGLDANWYHITYMAHRNSGYGSQIAVCFYTHTKKMLFRSSDGYVWGSWVKIATTDDILYKTVSGATYLNPDIMAAGTQYSISIPLPIVPKKKIRVLMVADNNSLENILDIGGNMQYFFKEYGGTIASAYNGSIRPNGYGIWEMSGGIGIFYSGVSFSNSTAYLNFKNTHNRDLPLRSISYILEVE